MGEELYQLPQGWAWALIGEIAETNPRLPEFDYSDDLEVSFLPMKALEAKTGRFDLSEIKQYSQVKKGYTPFLDGDVILAKITPCFENGKVAILKNLKNGIGFGSTEFHVFRLPSGVYNKYLFFYFQKHDFIKNAQRNMAGTAGQLRVPTDYIKNTIIFLPPLPEQHRIVAKIEELFTQLDAGVELLKKVKAKLKRYRQAVLKAAVEGNLTKEWREANQGELEPASVLLERILKQRREKWEAEQLAKMKAQGKTPKDDSWKLKYKEPIAPDISDLPELPDGWCWVSAEQCTSLITDGEHITPERSESGVLLLSARNVQNGWLSLEEVDYVPEHIYKILAKRLIVESGDVLLSCSGTVGRSCVAPEKLTFALVRSVAVLKPFLKMGKFLSYSIRSPLLQSQINKKKTQTAQANIFQGKIKQLVFALPNLLEQEKIVKEIEYCFSLIDQLENTINVNLKRAEKLRQTILKQAFEGKLVPQNPNDEPAEQLLERIKVDKAARESDKKSQRQPKIKSTQPHKSKQSSTQLELNFNNQNG